MHLIRLIDFFLPPAARSDLRSALPTRVLVVICLAGAILEPILSLRHFAAHNVRGGLLTLAVGVLGPALLAAVHRGISPNILMSVIAAVAVVASTVVSVTRGGFFISTLLPITLVPLCVGMVSGPRATLIWAAIASSALASLALVTHLGLLGLERSTALDAGPLLGFLFVATGVSLVHEHTRAGLERRKSELQRRVEETTRLEALGHLAAGVAHDFNNLLTVFHAAGEVLVAELPADHRLRPDAEAVRDAARRGATIARHLLAFSRPQALEPGAFDLVATVAEMEPLLRRALPGSIALKIEASTQGLRVEGDAGQLMNVLLNLVVNARDAMPGGGTVRIAIGAKEVPRGAGSGALAPGRYAAIEVCDDGVGISAEVLPHVFVPFFTTKTREHGSGLGLATAYGVVRAMRGEIRVVESASARGATFEILLPQLDESKAEAPRTAGSERPAPRARPTLLVVDDQPELTAAVRRLLARDFDVVTASSGAQALEICRERPEIAVVLTDVVMPTMGGVELASKLRALKPSISIVYMTGYSDDAAISREVEAGTARLVRKPFERATLMREIERAVLAAEEGELRETRD